jgi:hypothetical protein
MKKQYKPFSPDEFNRIYDRVWGETMGKPNIVVYSPSLTNRERVVECCPCRVNLGGDVDCTCGLEK